MATTAERAALLSACHVGTVFSGSILYYGCLLFFGVVGLAYWEVSMWVLYIVNSVRGVLLSQCLMMAGVMPCVIGGWMPIFKL